MVGAQETNDLPSVSSSELLGLFATGMACNLGYTPLFSEGNCSYETY